MEVDALKDKIVIIEKKQEELALQALKARYIDNEFERSPHYPS